MKLIVLEIVVGFGVPFAWGIWELVKLRREQRRDAEAAAANDAALDDNRHQDPRTRSGG